MKKIDGTVLLGEYKEYLDSMTRSLKAGKSLNSIMNDLSDKKLELFESEIFNEFSYELTWIEDAYNEGLTNGKLEVKEWFNFNNVYDFIYDLHSTTHKSYIEYYVNQGDDSIVSIYDILKCYCDSLETNAEYALDEEGESDE